MFDDKNLRTPLNCRLLAVEDNQDHQPLLSRILQKAGCHVTIAENGQIAVDLTLAARDEGRPFDIILMDLQMPVLDGLDATRMLRSNGVTSPIIAVTARAFSTDRRQCIEAGCSDFLPKPFDRAELVGLVASHLQPAILPH